VTAEYRNVQVDCSTFVGIPVEGPPRWNIANDQRHFGHDAPSEGFGLKGNSRAARPGHGDLPGITRAQSHRNRCDLIFALNERSPVFGKLAPQQFHDVDHGVNRITGPEPDTGGDEPISERFVAVS